MGVGSSTVETPSPAKGAPDTLGEQDRWTVQQLRELFEEMVRHLPVGADGRVGKADLEVALRNLSVAAAGPCSSNLCDWSTLNTPTSSKDAATPSKDAAKAVQDDHREQEEETEGTTDGGGDTPQDHGSERYGDDDHCGDYEGYDGVWEQRRLEEMTTQELRAYKAQLLLRVDEAMIEANELLGKAMAAQAMLDIDCIQRLIDAGRYTELGILVARMLHKLFSGDTRTHAHPHSPHGTYPCSSCGDRDSARHTHADYCRRLSTGVVEMEEKIGEIEARLMMLGL